MNTESIYTKGNSFRARAEEKARHYRENVLKLQGYDKWGHILSDSDGAHGMNFLLSKRNQILGAVKQRSTMGKGIDFDRTTKNLLSSQAMCFNLFYPLSINDDFLKKIMPRIVGNEFKEMLGHVNIEYTPSNEIFHDQSSKGGVDADVYIVYKTKNEAIVSLIIETKYVEKEFSQCGFTKSKKIDKCPENLRFKSNEFNKYCRYEDKKNYKYWTVAHNNNVFDLSKISICPFRKGLWQLFTNITLASGLAQRNNCTQFKYIVLCRKDNVELLKENFTEFKRILKNQNTFEIIYLEDLKTTLLECGQWGSEFIEKYIW